MLRIAARGLAFRPGRSAAVFALMVLAALAAVTGPVYARSAQQSVVRSVLADSPVDASGVILRYTPQEVVGAPDTASATILLPWAATLQPSRLYGRPVASSQVGVTLPTGDTAPLVWRQDACTHLRLTGRCPTGAGEVAVSARAAARLRLRVGSTTDVLPITGSVDQDPVPVGEGPPVALRVVGTYAPRDAGADYWFGRSYFADRDYQTRFAAWHRYDAVFTTEPTLQRLAAVGGTPIREVDLPLREARVGVDDVPAIRAGADRAVRRVPVATVTLASARQGNMLGEIRNGFDTIGLIVPIVAVQVVLLCWFVLFLLVGAAADERGPEIALARLRGMSGGRLAWFGLAETLLLLVPATLLGTGLAFAVVEGLGRWVFATGVHVEVTRSALGVAAAAFGGGLAAGVLATRRTLAAPVMALLMRVGGRTRGWRLAAADLVGVTLAAAAVYQLASDRGSRPSQLALLAPALLAYAVGTLAARVLPVWSARRTPRAVGRGRVVRSLALAQLGRRPGPRRLLTIGVVAIALLVFGATAWDVGARNRQLRAEEELGAPVVYTVDAGTPARLTAVVDAVDPDGRFAAAAVRRPAAADGTPLLAVEASRLPTVLGGRAASTLAAGLAATGLPEITVRGPDLAVDVRVGSVTTRRPLRLQALVDEGSGAAPVDLGRLVPGQGGRLAVPLPAGCRAGCRLAGLVIARVPGTSDPISGALTISAVLSGGRPVEARLGQNDAWRFADQPSSPRWRVGLAPGLAVTFSSEISDDIVLRYADTPSPSPALVAGTAPPTGPDGPVGPGLDGVDQPYRIAGRADTIPGLGRAGLLVDLPTDLRNQFRPTGDLSDVSFLVWASRSAPADLAARLARAGTPVLRTDTLAGKRAAFDRQGPALGFALYLLGAVVAALVAAMLVLTAGLVGGAARIDELAALRVAGVRASTLRRALLREYAATIALIVVLGTAVGAAVLVLALPSLPFFVDPPPDFRPELTPGPVVPAVAIALGALLLGTAAVVVVRSQLARATPDRLRAGIG